MEKDDMDALASSQRRELMAATQAETDLDIAFRLQMEEAMAASLALHPSSSSSSLPLPADSPAPGGDGEGDLAFHLRLQDMELERFQEERRDRERWREEMRRVSEELRRQAHDERFARDLLRIPDDEWEEAGDWFERPIEGGLGQEGEPFKLYFKGLSEPVPGSGGQYISAVGVAVCDPQGKVVLKIQKPISSPRVAREIMETKALIDGLHAVLSLGIRNLYIFFNHTTLYNHHLLQITRRWVVKQRKVADIVNQALTLLQKLEKHQTFLLPRCDMQFVFRLAKDAIDSQLVKTAENRDNKALMETCRICLEDTDPTHIFEVDVCLHHFCFSCMKQHVEVKLLHGIIPGCPHDGCNSRLNVESSKKFLTPRLAEILAQRITEASIPSSEKIYCPYPKCSALMARSETICPGQGSSSRQIVCERSGDSGLRKCFKCSGLFCINCKVPWHFQMSCYDYKRLNPYPPAEDAKLQFLANRNMWRQCVKCSHMIELASGCFHMTCRCGYEFCYTCGAEWKNKKATCSCPLWVEDNIVYNENAPEDYSEEDDDYYDTDEDYY